ncbi:LOW QUALITY PROTEIN: U3 small nucleolar RNA-associated protein 14 homolog A-like [Dermacentor silvarum]|uniref:LOW QUALITY PROTEIN: U3 small nucleolar RNA-associated protein 14 homolog A-like n=1 Tax=Dermacentor silvarum TaxID=543639 RepID=UPI001897936A|nr:LOW QUALITY PROTEIN: U3 small nucleolar RNA-associated protein 14 homolog A-like [Dermacentor silvarum]
MAAPTNSTLLDDLCKKPDVLQEEFGSDGEGRQLRRKGHVDSFRHKKLLDAIGSLGGKKKVTPRTEPSLTVSEYDLSKASVEKVAVHQLLMGLKKTDAHRQIKKKVRSIVRNAKVLAEPLPRPQLQRAQRQVAYEKVGEEVSVWEPVVKQNRVAEQLRFPLKQPDMRMESAGKFAERLKPKTDLEKEINKILKVSENVTPPGAELTPAEEKALKAMSLEEAKERLAELKKMRALLSYQEMKARRQGKIKSKKYHRILKKERLKKQMKEFEELKEKDPELAIEKLRELEKQRVLERVSLRHKGTGKWAKHQMLRTKYNQESREALLKQLELSRQLTQKPLVESSDDEDAMDSAAAKEVAAAHTGELEASFFNSANPWLKNPSVARPSTGADSVDDVIADAVSLEAVSGDGRGKDAVALPGDDGEEAVDKNCDVGAVGAADSVESEQEHLATTKGTEEKTAVEAETESCMINDEKEKNAELSKPKCGQAKLGSIKKGPKRKLASITKNGGKISAPVSKPLKPSPDEREDTNIDQMFDSLNEHAMKKRKKIKPGQKRRGQKSSKSVTFKERKEVNEKENNDNADSTTMEGLESAESAAQLDETLERKRTLKDLESFSKEKTPKPTQKRSLIPQPTQPEAKPDKVEVDPTKFLEVKQQILKSRAPDLGGTAEDALDDEDIEKEQAVTIAEAFADDDVISAFREEKKAQVKQDTPQGVDLFLPGWGSWGGGGIKVDRKKRRKFYVKPPPAPPRKDQTLGNVIISEAQDEKLEAHQVDALPFPFNNVSQFEAVISHPVGSLWNPETSFRELTAPKVVAKIGQVIDPIDTDALTLKKKENVVDKLLERQKAEAKHKQQPQRRRKKK